MFFCSYFNTQDRCYFISLAGCAIGINIEEATGRGRKREGFRLLGDGIMNREKVKIDYMSYWSAKPYVGVSDLKEKLPISVQKGLLQGEKFEHGIYVETSATDIVKQIDKVFKIGKKKEVTKFRHLEVNKAEISNYTHFQINPKELEHDRQLLFDLMRPQCKSEVCPWGSGISSPIIIKQKSLKNLGIAQIGRLWGNRPELIISSEVKALFDSEGVTGLKYEPCVNETDKASGISGKTDAYLTTIVPETYQLADDIILKNHCRKHHIILNYEVFNIRTPIDVILDYDFQTIKGLKVGRKAYTYYRGHWIISRKVLRLLFEHKIPGLKPYGRVLAEKFIPFLIDVELKTPA
ncbi:MAG: hypothetical protein ACYS18_02090 [Planctomycetota bacterium]|jgi:hypothetical protein